MKITPAINDKGAYAFECPHPLAGKIVDLPDHWKDEP